MTHKHQPTLFEFVKTVVIAIAFGWVLTWVVALVYTYLIR
jgi:hypothetical protein